MDKNQRTGTIGALLHEYEKAIRELQQVITVINPASLLSVVDPNTANPDCRSIQSILTHVVKAGYSYSVYIENLGTGKLKRPEKVLRLTAAEYIDDLDQVFNQTVTILIGLSDEDLEKLEQEKKILTSWGQYYDIEQMLEHAIVHVLKHRFQVERFKNRLSI